ncbi:MAG: hypothetical protein II374_04310 [Lachnospiraceae bacterium]|nr:hypothetical protein [Lachnospiraceae bacterium]MBQ2320547.1 hypothetical protein [Lachnospiraceae bacterium]
MGKKEEILEYCTKKNEQLTAREIVEALYPGKAQSYVNTVINKLVEEKKLIKVGTRPYKVYVADKAEEKDTGKSNVIDMQEIIAGVKEGKYKLVLPEDVEDKPEPKASINKGRMKSFLKKLENKSEK